MNEPVQTPEDALPNIALLRRWAQAMPIVVLPRCVPEFTIDLREVLAEIYSLRGGIALAGNESSPNHECLEHGAGCSGASCCCRDKHQRIRDEQGHSA